MLTCTCINNNYVNFINSTKNRFQMKTQNRQKTQKDKTLLY